MWIEVSSFRLPQSAEGKKDGEFHLGELDVWIHTFNL